MQLFHLTGMRLAPGSIILAGNWGRVISKFQWGHNLNLREQALEDYRRLHAPHLPSRLTCSYSFLTEEEALRFRVQTQGWQTTALHKVRFANATANSFVAYTDALTGAGTWDEWRAGYWNGVAGIIPGVMVDQNRVVGMEPARIREVLALSDLVIEECLD